MKRIVDFLADPAWWFTAVFVGVMASLFASYLRDVIGRAVATVSARQRKRSETRARELARRADELAADKTMFLLANMKAIGATVVFFCLLLLSVLLIVLFFGPLSSPLEASERVARIVLLLLVVFATLAVGDVLSVRIHTLKEALRIYSEARHDKEAG